MWSLWIFPIKLDFDVEKLCDIDVVDLLGSNPFGEKKFLFNINKPQKALDNFTFKFWFGVPIDICNKWWFVIDWDEWVVSRINDAFVESSFENDKINKFEMKNINIILKFIYYYYYI